MAVCAAVRVSAERCPGAPPAAARAAPIGEGCGGAERALAPVRGGRAERGGAVFAVLALYICVRCCCRTRLCVLCWQKARRFG